MSSKRAPTSRKVRMTARRREALQRAKMAYARAGRDAILEPTHENLAKALALAATIDLMEKIVSGEPKERNTS